MTRKRKLRLRSPGTRAARGAVREMVEQATPADVTVSRSPGLNPPDVLDSFNRPTCDTCSYWVPLNLRSGRFGRCHGDGSFQGSDTLRSMHSSSTCGYRRTQMDDRFTCGQCTHWTHLGDALTIASSDRLRYGRCENNAIRSGHPYEDHQATDVCGFDLRYGD